MRGAASAQRRRTRGFGSMLGAGSRGSGGRSASGTHAKSWDSIRPRCNARLRKGGTRMGHSLCDSVRLLEHARSGTRVAWLVLATLRDADGVINETPDALMQCTGLGRVALAAALTKLLELGLIVPAGGERWRLTTDFTRTDTAPELPLGDPSRPLAVPTTPPAAGHDPRRPCDDLEPIRAGAPSNQKVDQGPARESLGRGCATIPTSIGRRCARA